MSEVVYKRKIIKFMDFNSYTLRRTEFDIARTPVLDCLYDPEGGSRLHALLMAGALVPIHPWETHAMTEFRASATSTTSPLPLAATMAFHGSFRAALLADHFLELEGMTRDNADEQFDRTRDAIHEQDDRMPRYSEKVGEWIGSVAFWLEDVDWSCNDIIYQSDSLRDIVLNGGHVGAPCLRLCHYWRRNYLASSLEDMDFQGCNELFVSTVVEARAERPKRHWAKARACILPIAKTRCIAYFWLELAARPGPNGQAPAGAVAAFAAEF